MNLRERLAALRSRRTSSKLDIPSQLVLNSPSPKGTPSKKSRLHSEAARRQWHQQQLHNAARKARQNVMETGLYDVLTRAPPPEKVVPPLVKEEKQADAQPSDSEDEDEEGEHVEIDEEQMEIYEEERALQHANRQLLFDDHSVPESSKLSLDQPRKDITAHSCEKKVVLESPDTAELQYSEQVDDPDPIHKEQPTTNMTTSPVSVPDHPPSFAGPNALQSGPHQSQQLKEQHTVSKENNRSPQNEDPTISSVKANTRLAPLQDTSPQTPDQPALKGAEKKDALRFLCNDRLSNPLGIVDEEADEENAGGNGAVSHELEAIDSDGDDDCIDHDEVAPSAIDRNNLAQFHRMWQLDKDKNDLAVAAAGGVVDDIDDAVDLTELLHKEEQTAKDNESEHDGSVFGAAPVSNEVDETKQQSEQYMEQMFQRDDSRSRIIDNINEDAEDDQKREKARALWKARQKAKAILQRDNDSLSKFDLFDSNSKSRSADFRQKLEKTCRRSSPHLQSRNENNKRNNSWLAESTLSAWEKQRREDTKEECANAYPKLGRSLCEQSE
ncbi:unnamed protein product [Agarophyton chilense]